MGALVWAAGIGARPVVKKLAQQLGQGENARGLKVDDRLQVLGADGVFAIGDCALSGNAPTAQVAAQQGKYVGRAIRDRSDKPFEYKHAGSLLMLPRLRQRDRCSVAAPTPGVEIAPLRGEHESRGRRSEGRHGRAGLRAVARHVLHATPLAVDALERVRGLDPHLAQRPRRERARAEAHDDARGVGVGATQPRSRRAADRTPGPDFCILP